MGRMGYKNGATLITNFIKAGYEFVVFEYIFPGKAQMDFVLNQISVDIPIHLITLWAELDVVKGRELCRKNRNRLNERVEQCYHEMNVNLQDFKNIVDTTYKSTSEVVEKIKSIILTE